MVLLAALAVCQCVLPVRHMSKMENRVLSTAPGFSVASFVDGSYSEGLEDFAADQLPLRDGFVALYSSMQAALGRRMSGDAIVGRDGMLFDRSDKWSERNVRLNAAALTELAALTGRRVQLLAVPSAAAVYPEKVPAHAPLADEPALLAAAAGETGLIPLLPRLQEAGGVPLYYATDHHWTVEGARIGYEAVCQALNLAPGARKPAVSVPGFYGSFYARYPLPWLQPDTFSYLPYDGIRLLVNGEEKEHLIDADVLAGRDKYAALLYGNHGLVELINEAAPEGELLVIKDSYANALLPALAMHYRRVVAVDPRYFAGDVIELAKTCEGEEILCVYGMNTLASGRTIALLEGL